MTNATPFTANILVGEPGATGPAGIASAAGSDSYVQYNMGGNLASNGSLTWSTSGLYNKVPVAVAAGVKLQLDNTGSSYFIYNSSENAVELYVNNTIKRRYT